MGLWVRGFPQLGHVVDRAVAVIGSRASTAYGEYVAGDISQGLAGRG